MKKKTKNLLVLLGALVIVVGLFVAISLMPDKKEEEEDTPKKSTSIQLNEIVADDIVKVEYKGENSAMVLVKEDDEWVRDDNRDFPVNQSYVTNMARAVASLKATKLVTETPEDIGEFGLANPLAWVRITDNKGTQFELFIGERGTQGDGCYVKTGENDTIYLASVTLMNQYTYTENQMIAKLSTPSIVAAQITRILIEKPEGNLELSLEYGNDLDVTGYNPWLMRQGLDDVVPASSDMIQTLVDNYAEFTFADSVEYDCQDMAQYGLDDEHATKLTLTYYDMVDSEDTDEVGNYIQVPEYHTFAIKFGNLNDSGAYRYVNLDGTTPVYFMKAETVETMTDLKPIDYVSKLQGLVNVADVDNVTIEYNGKKQVISIEKTKDENDEDELTYFFNGNEVDKKTFTSVYTELIGVRVDGLADNEIAAAHTTPVITITYDRTSAGLKPVVTELFEYDDNFGRIAVNGLSYFRINGRDIEKLINLFDEKF